ncbi:hypothetical protein [Latilactobacillus fuchuensis]|uniref:hypothetical protein n=1 Tax=Latilactobacillus fuchuensis TaxID=164393 RepID=UPI0020C81280|nr:hypothetical protein [Latilactobacillus fuchuensis]MCP8857569.1 hypothetical protein [Latilactobacillus fuchuensis]
MKRIIAVFSLICLFALPFVSPYLFDKGMTFAKSHPTSAIQFDAHQQPKVQHKAPSDQSEAHLTAFNQRFEHYFDQLTLSKNALVALITVFTLSILAMLSQPLLAYLGTCHQTTPKKQPAPDKARQKIAAYKHHLLG